jgi:putative ABC transport system ATP-binding protein
MGQTEPIIEVTDLSRTFHAGKNRVAALQGVSLRVHAGEFVAVMGPSGSGKSTMMNILGCLDWSTSGRYLLQGMDVTCLHADRLAEIRNTMIGFVFQGFQLMARMTALENVILPLVYAETAAGERRRRAEEVLARVGLSGREQHLPGEMSGGEQQRVAVARALINEPRLILADEPTGNLDSATARQVMGLLAGLNREHGITIVLITHEKDIASYAGRILKIRDGRIVSDASNETVAA